MSEPNYTPPPWRTMRDNFISGSSLRGQLESARVVYSERGFDVAYCPPTDGDNGNTNARLIAAAPALLAELRALWQDYGDRWTKARSDRVLALLAAADGR